MVFQMDLAQWIFGVWSRRTQEFRKNLENVCQSLTMTHVHEHTTIHAAFLMPNCSTPNSPSSTGCWSCVSVPWVIQLFVSVCVWWFHDVSHPNMTQSQTWNGDNQVWVCLCCECLEAPYRSAGDNEVSHTNHACVCMYVCVFNVPYLLFALQPSACHVHKL